VAPRRTGTAPEAPRDATVEQPVTEPDSDATHMHTSRRILEATAEVLGRSGFGKLSLSDVATQAGVSRPTLYRWFASKEELIDAFSRYETEKFDNGIADAIAGLRGTARLDAALRFMVDFQRSYSGVRMIDVEPEQVLARFTWVLPIMRSKLERLISGPDAALAAATATRVAVSHYVVRSDDADQFLAQLRHAVGIRPRPSRPAS
jgi:AcrR family transcriptional regulator